ncbi:HIRAN domain-containing protein [Nitrolancea hollandica]|uniref:HIRAN domain-containing protein n=1 Tax=Nitrolancea hollandica Lb TaxID=1129897 RepID=I4EFZ2_9BACT|nr:HIRAN domain-containing protein [Nitrolancea hollandica]CCF83604.1 hypothetical protein NITHO_2510002 [Nitrolancea hollandica Lb]
MGDWYKDKKRQVYVATYEDQKKMQKEVEAATKHGWEIKDTTTTGGHVHLGRSLALGGVNWLVGKGRSKDKVTITFLRATDQGEAEQAGTQVLSSALGGRIQTILVDGEEDVYVVGESFYQDELKSLVQKALKDNSNCDPHRVETVAILAPEPRNKHDPNAVQVKIDGKRIGYLSREDAEHYQPSLVRLAKKLRTIACNGIIVGGREEGHSYGVVLFLPSVIDEADITG